MLNGSLTHVPVLGWEEIWESLVKSVKRSLKVITRDFTEAPLYMFLCEVESVINNCPLTPASDSISNHFLLGTKVTNYALGSFNHPKINYCKNGKLFNMFWNRWLREHLRSLTGR